MYRGFIKEIYNLTGLPIGNSDLRILDSSIKRDILTKASSSFEVIGAPDEAKNGHIFGCYDDYGKIRYLGVITNIETKEHTAVIQTDQIVSIFDDNWLWRNPELETIELSVKSIIENDFAINRDSMVSTIFSQFDILVSGEGTYLSLGTQNDHYVKNFMNFIFELYENYQILVDIQVYYKNQRPTIIISKPAFETIKLIDNNNVLKNINVMKETYETNKLVLYDLDGGYRGTWFGTETGITDDDDYTNRLPKIKTNIVFSDDDAEDVKAQNLRSQMYNHKIEVELVLANKLYDFDSFNLGQTFLIRHEGKDYESVLTGYELKIDRDGISETVKLIFGIVRVSLVDKLNKLTTNTQSLSSAVASYSGGGGGGGGGTSDYSELTNKPRINGVTLSGNKTSAELGIVIPTATSDLTNDSNFVSDSNYVHTDSNYTAVEKAKLAGIAAGAEVNVQSDWNETDPNSDAYILNKPSITPGGDFKFVKGTPINLYDTDETTVLHSLMPENLLFYDNIPGSAGEVLKFIKGQPINLYDTDGETVLYSRNPENLVFYDGGSGEEIANSIIWAQPSANVTFGASYVAPNLIAKNAKGNGFEISNGAIKCNKNGKIQVNAVADVFRSSSANDDCYIAICKNDTNVSIGTTTFQIYTRNLSTIAVIDVVEGDVITFKVKANSVTGSTLYTSSDIICEYVEDYYITKVQEFPDIEYTNYDATTTGTNTTTQNKYWSVNGTGIVIMTCSSYTDTTSDTGSSNVVLYKNDAIVANNYNRLNTATAEVQRCSCTVALSVEDGDTLRAYQNTTKNGSKTFLWHILCLGCTVTETAS